MGVVPAPSRPRGEILGLALSPGELRTAAAYASIGDQRQAAGRLGVSVRTVKTHLQGAYRKAGVDSAIDLFRALGWLRVPQGLEF